MRNKNKNAILIFIAAAAIIAAAALVFKNIEKIEQSKAVLGIVSHHDITVLKQRDFFAELKKQNKRISTFIIFGTNHFETKRQIVFAEKSALSQKYFANLLNILPTSFEDFSKIKEDHSIAEPAAILREYFPKAEILPILFPYNLKESEIDVLAEICQKIINNNKDVFLLGSLDFAHYLPLTQAQENTNLIKNIILQKGNEKELKLNNGFVDSAAILSLILKISKINELNPEIFYQGSSVDFGYSPNNVTTYLFVNYKK